MLRLCETPARPAFVLPARHEALLQTRLRPVSANICIDEFSLVPSRPASLSSISGGSRLRQAVRLESAIPEIYPGDPRRRLVSHSTDRPFDPREARRERGQLVLRARIRIPCVAIASRAVRKGGGNGLPDVIDESNNIPLRRGQLTRTPR